MQLCAGVPMAIPTEEDTRHAATAKFALQSVLNAERILEVVEGGQRPEIWAFSAV